MMTALAASIDCFTLSASIQESVTVALQAFEHQITGKRADPPALVNFNVLTSYN